MLDQAAQAASLLKREVAVSRSNGDPGHSRCRTWSENLQDELLNGKIFYSLREAQIIIESWRPHSALGYRLPALETLIPVAPRPIMH